MAGEADPRSDLLNLFTYHFGGARLWAESTEVGDSKATPAKKKKISGSRWQPASIEKHSERGRYKTASISHDLGAE